MRKFQAAQQSRELTKQKAANLFVFISMIAGLRFTSLRLICAFLDVPIPAKSIFYEAQLAIVPDIIALARRSCAMMVQLTLGHTLSFDGAWAHARWSLQCL
jgi:hypothetical protein